MTNPKYKISYLNSDISSEDQSDIESKVLNFCKEYKNCTNINCKHYIDNEKHFWDIVIRFDHDYFHARTNDIDANSSIDKAIKKIKEKIA